jgi:hypothetical protein
LYADPEFGFINVCDSSYCKEKAISDLKYLSDMADNNKNRQGRTEQQVEASERAMAYAIIGLTLATFILTIISFLKK